MPSVTDRINEIKQPYGGYLRRRDMTVIQRDDNLSLSDNENINPGLIGCVVDYMTRYLTGQDKAEAFSVSLNGAMLYTVCLGAKEPEIFPEALDFLNDIKKLGRRSIISACKLANYDVFVRAGAFAIYRFDPFIKPNKDTVDNIIIMVKRCLSFIKEYGPITKAGFTFEGSYTNAVSSGDGDYLTSDTLWDFKTSKRDPTSKDTLQLLMYYIMGKHSVHPEFQQIHKLGFFNPRLNKAYIIDTNSIPLETINIVSKDVIGY